VICEICGLILPLNRIRRGTLVESAPEDAMESLPGGSGCCAREFNLETIKAKLRHTIATVTRNRVFMVSLSAGSVVQVYPPVLPD
jgi:hypothetical protein